MLQDRSKKSEDTDLNTPGPKVQKKKSLHIDNLLVDIGLKK